MRPCKHEPSPGNNRREGGADVPQLLLLEQDGPLAEQLVIRLEQERIVTRLADSGREGLALLEDGQFDLAVISDQLPDLSGEGLLIELRERRAGMPVMLFSSSSDIRRRIRYYRLGANDVVTKPLMFEELIVRIWNLLKLAGKAERFLIRVDGLVVDPESRTVEMEGEQVPLTPTEFDLLLFLVRHEGKPLSRAQILQQVWGYPVAGQTNLVDVYIRYLRLKIDRKYRKKLFHTVRGFGYMFDAAKEDAAD